MPRKRDGLGVELRGTFPQRLYQARRDKGWSQSDLARRVWGETKDSRGYLVARNRDRVSMYESGKATPTLENLHQLAKALGVTAEELSPTLNEPFTAPAQRAVNLTMLEGRPNEVHLTVDVIVPVEQAARVLAILSETPEEKDG